jgi:hypothetical protein
MQIPSNKFLAIVWIKFPILLLIAGLVGTSTLLAGWESILKNADQTGSNASSGTESDGTKEKKSSQQEVTDSSKGDASQDQVESSVPVNKSPKADSTKSDGDGEGAYQSSLHTGQPKEALLIANGDYAHFGKLANPVSDARLLKKSLQQIGFKVTLVENASRESMLEALQSFQDRLKVSHAIALFHYGGHGVQVDGHNYFIPADADIPDERKVTTRAVDLDEVMTTLDASSSTANVVILDACRDNPLPATKTRGATRGLTVVQSKPKNSLIIFAAEAGSRANDGLFTPALANAITKPGKSLSQTLKDVRREVFQKSNGTQTPGEYDQLFEDLYLCSQPNAQPPSTTHDSSTNPIKDISLQTPDSTVGSQSPDTPYALVPPPISELPAQTTTSLKTNFDKSSNKKYYITGLDPNGDNWLALKSAPNLHAPRLRKLPPDTSIIFISRDGNWTQVSLDDGSRGWVYSKYVRSR